MPTYDLPNFIQTANVDITVDTSTTSTTFVDLLTTTITTSVGDTLLCKFASSSLNASAVNLFQLLIDNVVYQHAAIRTGASVTILCPASMIVKVSGIIPGNHIIKVQWCVTGSTGYIRPISQANYEFASLTVIEDIPCYDKSITYGLIQTLKQNIVLDTTTTSTSMVDLITINSYTIGGDLLIYFNCCSSNSNANSSHYFQIMVDSTINQSGSVRYVDVPAINMNLFSKVTGLSADAHTITVQWRTSGNMARIRPIAAAGSECAQLLVMEMKS